MDEQEMSLEDGCCICAILPVEEAFGYNWCADHYERVSLLELGEKHGYPALRAHGEKMKYAIAEGKYHWMTAALLGSDDYILALFQAIDELDMNDLENEVA